MAASTNDTIIALRPSGKGPFKSEHTIYFDIQGYNAVSLLKSR